MEIKARLTRRDKDIEAAISRLNLKEGELLSDVVRDGMRKELKDRGVLEGGKNNGSRHPQNSKGDS